MDNNVEFRLNPGDPAPEFCLPNQDEKQVCLRDLSGKRFVLYIYPKDATPGCTTEACDFNDRLPSILPIADVLGLSPDTPESHRRFRAKYDLNFPLLSDPTLETIKAFGAYGTKMNYGKEFQGLLRSTFVIGPTGSIELAMYNVRAKGHAERIVGQLSKL